LCFFFLFFFVLKKTFIALQLKRYQKLSRKEAIQACREEGDVIMKMGQRRDSGPRSAYPKKKKSKKNSDLYSAGFSKP